MALGGGVFLAQNKVLPGAYINFISSSKATAGLSGRGVCTMALEMDWGKDEEVFEVTAQDFAEKSKELFGYNYDHEKLKGLRDLFLNAKKLYAYRLNTGEKATCEYATAKCSGTRGNKLIIVIQKNVDEESKFNISTVFDNKIVDTQTVGDKSELVSNDFVDFKENINITKVTSGTPLSGGTNGTVSADNHSNYLKKIEGYQFNVMGLISDETTIKKLYTSFTKRLRDEVGQKFQTVIFNHKADYEGIINVKNSLDLVYFVTGLEAGTNINKSCLNKVYDGEFEVNIDYTQAELEKAIRDGEFTLHKVGDELRVLSDVNSLVTTTAEKGEGFKDNQTIRVIDQIAIDVAHLFNTKYLGQIPNDKSGRMSLWADLVKYHEELQKLRAIEDFKDEDITVQMGDSKKSVVISDMVTIINAMEKLYMVVKIA